jgi:hypothetical protein
LRKAAAERIAWYHDAEARRLAGRLEASSAAFLRDAIDVFALDDVVAQYRRARRALDAFCWTSRGAPGAAGDVDASGPIDWWQHATDRRRRCGS